MELRDELAMRCMDVQSGTSVGAYGRAVCIVRRGPQALGCEEGAMSEVSQKCLRGGKCWSCGCCDEQRVDAGLDRLTAQEWASLSPRLQGTRARRGGAGHHAQTGPEVDGSQWQDTAAPRT